MIKKHIPNSITLLNLSSGVVAVLLAAKGQLHAAAYMVVIASVFDFFDGFAARLLHVKSNIGKELDSLSDVVSFGVAPAVIMYALLCKTAIYTPVFYEISVFPALVAVLFPCFVALRLAKFNLDERQTSVFFGLPSPAAAFVLISLPFFPLFDGSFYLYAGIIVMLCVLMLSDIQLFALKFTNYNIKDNIFRYILMTIALFLLLCLQERSLPFIITVYIALSVVGNVLNKLNRKKLEHGN
jgi:CDP-diacylglycerol--serine O-phosphatidyltransferase